MFVLVVTLCIAKVLLLVGLSYARVLYEYFRKAKVLINDSVASNDKRIIKEFSQAPGPFPWPLIGNLDLLNRSDVPFQTFTELTNDFGDAYSLTLGSTRCLVVNNLELIREVLNQNGKFFGGRPDFLRYHKLFGGDRNNSLALCDWSHLQQRRRNLARRHCSPRDSSSYFMKMSNVGCLETNVLMDKIQLENIPGEPLEIKPLIQQTCANMFLQYMCTIRFEYEDAEFQRIVEFFDEIFWEINQGYAVDFLPWLAPFYSEHISKIMNWSTTIRQFILEKIINEREQNLDLDEPEKDFTDALLKSLVEDKNVSRNTIIFMLEDFIGGHSAVGNLVMLALAYLVKFPNIAARIQAEVDMVSDHGQRKITLYDMEKMPLTLATIFEVLRYSSSPIVPHVATQDTVICGYGVTSGTIVFINNYILNTSKQYWNQPELFDPERFLERVPVKNSNTVTASSSKIIDIKRRNSEGSDSGVEFERDATITTSTSDSAILKILKSDVEKKDESIAEHFKVKVQIKKNIPHFLPFSIGKRTCIGQNLVRGFSFILLANILQQYNVSSNDLASIHINPACVALPAKTFPLVFTQRSSKLKF